MEYYYHDQLRWAFGFDNPNKAAAFIASLLPLVWILTVGIGQWKPPLFRRIGMVAGAIVLCGSWWLLFKTCSRGGVVAALVAFAYIGFCRRNSWKKDLTMVSVCGALIVALFFATRAAERSVAWIGSKEASVENRWIVWKGGLEMLAGNPGGVGPGRSGELYMQWYQPTDMTTGYRTLVNSYLTFVVERGLAFSVGLLFLALVIWNISAPAKTSGFRRNAIIGLRASLIALAVAGLFTTTMEEAVLWAVPAFCMAALGLMKWTARDRTNVKADCLRAAVVSCAICGVVFLAGWWIARREPLGIQLSANGKESVTITPTKGSGRRLYVLPDESVLGRDSGKLLRRLALDTCMTVIVGENPESNSGNSLILACGEGVRQIQNRAGNDLVLLAPAAMEEAEAAKLLSAAKSVKLLLPSFDEDGRVSLWEDAADRSTEAERIKVLRLDGVGTQVEWAWEVVTKETR